MKKSAGFTLVEMLAAVAVLAVLLGIATPSFIDMVDRNRAAASANDVMAAVQIARSEAVRQRRPVVLCRRGTDAVCEDGTDWSVGWVVGPEDPANAGEIVAGTEIRIWEQTRGGLNLVGVDQGIVFVADGRTRLAGDQTITITPRRAAPRVVSVSPTGRASVK